MRINLMIFATLLKQDGKFIFIVIKFDFKILKLKVLKIKLTKIIKFISKFITK